MSGFKIKKDPINHKPQKFLRWSPMMDFPKGMDRQMIQEGPITYSLHAKKDRLEERGLPILSEIDSRGFNLSECVIDYGSLFKKHPKATLVEHIKPYLIHIDTTIDPVTKEDVFQCAAWRFTILSEPRFVKGRMRDVKVDMTVVVNDVNEVVTAILTDKDDYTFHNKQVYATHESRASLLREILLEQTKDQLGIGKSITAGFGNKEMVTGGAMTSKNVNQEQKSEVEQPATRRRPPSSDSGYSM